MEKRSEDRELSIKKKHDRIAHPKEEFFRKFLQNSLGKTGVKNPNTTINQNNIAPFSKKMWLSSRERINLRVQSFFPIWQMFYKTDKALFHRLIYAANLNGYCFLDKKLLIRLKLAENQKKILSDSGKK